MSSSLRKLIKSNALRLQGRLGVRAKMVFLFVCVFGFFFASFCASVFVYIDRTHKREFDSALYNYVIDVSHSITMRGLDDDEKKAASTAGSELILPFSLGEALLQISDAKGELVYRSKSLQNRMLPFSDIYFAKLETQNALYEDIPLSPQGRYRMVSHVTTADSRVLLVQAAVPMILLDRQQDAMFTFFVLSVPLILIFAAVFGLAFSRRAMAPVSAIIAKTKEIEAKHLSEEIPVPESRDEIHDLATTLNGLLRRLEKAFRAQEGFVADASHQLKTPLSILKGELEMFQRGDRTAEDTQNFLTSAAQEIDYLSRMVEDLLTLATMDTVGSPTGFSPLRLDEKVLESVARFERASKAKGLRFSIQLQEAGESNAFVMQGEPELLRALLDNILHNAVKYSPDNGLIQVLLKQRGGALQIRIEDSGPGIPQGLLQRVFERFYRSESTRDIVSGAGLGLSIVQRIAELHLGSVRAFNRDQGGACFEVNLPATQN